MPQPTTKEERKEKLEKSNLDKPKKNKPTPLEPCSVWKERKLDGDSTLKGATSIAFGACGLQTYRIVAPRTYAKATATPPKGPISLDYAPPHAIRERNDVRHPGRNPYGRRLFVDVLAEMRYEAEQAGAEMGDLNDEPRTRLIRTGSREGNQ